VELGAIDPLSKDLSLKLDRLSLYAPDLSQKLHDYPLQQADDAASSSSDGIRDGVRRRHTMASSYAARVASG
jgi:hypothetical protein